MVNIINKGKKYITFISFLAVIVCFACSCQSEKTSSTYKNDTEKIQNELIGKWQWKETTGGLAGKKLNPSTAGYTKEIDFYKNNTYKIYKNSSLQKDGTYKIVKKKAINGRQEYIIQYSEGLDEIVKIIDDNLLLTENVYDGFSEAYVRIK